jgi:hypothetical protein
MMVNILKTFYYINSYFKYLLIVLYFSFLNQSIIIKNDPKYENVYTCLQLLFTQV